MPVLLFGGIHIKRIAHLACAYCAYSSVSTVGAAAVAIVQQRVGIGVHP